MATEGSEQIEVGSLLRDEGEQVAYPCALTIPQGDERWRAVAPDLEGCSSEGDGARECVANITDAVVAWIEAAQAEGDELPLPSAIDRLARLPEFRKALWTLAVVPRKGIDLEMSKELADAGILPTTPVIPPLELPREQPSVQREASARSPARRP